MTRLPASPAITIAPDEIAGERLEIPSFNALRANPDAWHALRRWLISHGINDTDVVPSGAIIRNPKARTIEYTGVVRDEAGRRTYRAGDPVTRRIVRQLDKMPMPWPVEVLELAVGRRA